MSTTGKTIRIYLADGVPSGILVAEIMNWTGKVVVAPRSALANLMGRPEVRRTGVYVLVGADPGNPARERVYIGEGDEVRKRLLSHDADESKEFWTRTVVVTSKDENLTKAHIRYLESRMIQLVDEAGRASLANGTAPAPNLLPEPDVADMEFFLSQIRLILPVLGFTFTRPKSASVASDQEQDGRASTSPLFVMKAVGVDATAQEVDGEFIVLKGSTARKHGVSSWVSYKDLRDQLIVEGKLIESSRDGYLVFTEDTPFASPSAAAAVIYGGNQNGRVAWRLKDGGVTYKEWQEGNLKAAVRAADMAATELR